MQSLPNSSIQQQTRPPEYSPHPGTESAIVVRVQISCHSIAAFGIAITLTLAACGGSDADNTTEPVATAGDSADDIADDTTPEGPELIAVEVPADWDPSVPTGPADAMTLTFAESRPFDDSGSIYELEYNGNTGLDAQTVFSEYEAMVLAAGWTAATDTTQLVGSYSLDDRTLTIVVVLNIETLSLIVSAIPN
jgi:hypothetical protein